MFGLFQNIGIWELLIILLVILIIFGPGKLPELGKAIGKGMRSFRDAQRDIEKDITNISKEPEDDKKKSEHSTEDKAKSE